MNNKNLLYKVVANYYEMESFKREVFLSHKLAILTSKRSSKYVLFHDSDNKELLNRFDKDKSFLNELTHNMTYLPEFSHKDNVKRSFTTVMEVLERYDLEELLGLLVNYNYAYPKAFYNKYYFLQDKANTYVAENIIRDILNWLDIEDDIPIIVGSEQKNYKAIQKSNTIRSSFNDCNICGIVIKAYEINDKNYIKGVSFDEYIIIRDFFKYLNNKSNINLMRYNDSESKLYQYLKFRVKYSSSVINETLFAAFNGLFYFYSYFIKKGVIKYDSLFKVLENTFKIDIDIDEIISLNLISEDYIVTDKDVVIDNVYDELQNEIIDEYESNIAEQHMNAAPKQYDKDDIERVYKSMCYSKFKNYVIYDEQNKDAKQNIINSKAPFFKYFKKQKRYALCFLEDEKSTTDTNPKGEFILTFITEVFQNIDQVTADEKAVDMLHKCILEHNQKIQKKTVGSSNNLIKYNVFDNHKYYMIFFDVDNLDNLT